MGFRVVRRWLNGPRGDPQHASHGNCGAGAACVQRTRARFESGAGSFGVRVWGRHREVVAALKRHGRSLGVRVAGETDSVIHAESLRLGSIGPRSVLLEGKRGRSG